MSSAVVVASTSAPVPAMATDVAKDKEERRTPIAIDISKSKVPVPRIHIKLNPDAVNEISYQKLLTQYVDAHPEATIFKPVAADEAVVPSSFEANNRTSGSEAEAPGKQIDRLKQLLGPEQDDEMPGPKNRFTSLMESWLVRLEKTGLLAHPDDITASKKALGGRNAKKKKHNKKKKLDGVVADGSQNEESSVEDESKYDLDDPWLDDSELVLGDESHENMQTEQSGYFVNKGDISIVRRPKDAVEPEMSDSPFEKKRKRSKIPATSNEASKEKPVETVEEHETVEKPKRKRKRKTFHDEMEPNEEPVKPAKPSKKIAAAGNETEEPPRKKKKKTTDSSATTEKKTDATVSTDVADVADAAESKKASKKKSKSKTSLPLPKETTGTTPTGKKEKKDKTVSKSKETKEDDTSSSKQPVSAPESSGPTWGETFDTMPKFDENHFKIMRIAPKTGGSQVRSGSDSAFFESHSRVKAESSLEKRASSQREVQSSSSFFEKPSLQKSSASFFGK
eukprot:GILJ01012355.1.p1 GENE.GILJ01012355.1~~GILJ01012355.1.p1  ORF type:complete len:509 (-),score=117.27 GILJ01012355.1:160-1686(-)